MLYAHWKANSYTVRFDLNGGTATTVSKKVTYGKSYGTLPTPKRTGYTFAGWYSKDEYGSKRTSASIVDVAADHTLYAKWKSEIFTVTFNPKEGTVAIKDVAVTKGKTYSDFPTPYKEGYEFTGWYTASGSSGLKVTSIAVTDILYAHWQGKPYRVQFDVMGGKLPSAKDESKIVVFGGTYGELPTPTKYGFTFSGWYTGETTGYKKTAATEVTQAEDHTLYARWKGISSKISYDANGGKAITGTKTVTYGSEYGTLSTTTRTGYHFAGWYTSAVGGEPITEESIVTAVSNHTLYAHWEVATPVIKFVGNGGKVENATEKASSLEQIYTYGKAYTSFPKATRTGYRFLGWFTSTSGGTQITEKTICDVTTSDTFYAQWQGKESQVSFNPNGGIIDVKAITVYYSGKYGTLPVPVKEGYTFKGWYTEKYGGDLIESDTKVEIEESQTLYARWEINTYQITLDGNGGTSVIISADGSSSAVTKRNHKVPYSGTYSGTLKEFPKFSRSGYDFTGFYTEDGLLVTPAKEFTFNNDQTLYAGWRAKRISVTLNENGADPISETRTVLFGGTYGELPELERTGYTFNGWTKTKDSTLKITEATVVNTRTAHDIYASWVAKQYQVSFYANGGSSTASSKTVAYGSAFGTLPTATRSGYAFEGWYTEKEGGKKVTSSSIVDVADNIKLYAHWKKGVYQITFNANAGTAGTCAKEVFAEEMYGAFPGAERRGYDFTGWYTKRTEGERVDEADKVGLTGNQTLYAQWKVRTPNVLFYADGGNLDTAIKTVRYGEAYGTLPAPTLENYTFEGWYTKPEGGEKVTDTSIVSVDGTHTLYARWIPLTVTVTFDPAEGSVAVSQKEVAYETNYGELPFPEREGYCFAGWYTEKQGGKHVTDKTAVRETTNHTLYAHWEKVKSVILFYANGGTVDIQEKEGITGEPYGELPSAERNGYIFLGWYTQKEGGAKVEATDCVPEVGSITLYAHWQSEKLTVTFDAMGGSIEEDTKQVVFGEEYGVLSVPKKEGYRFVAWYLDTEWQKKVEAATVVTTPADHTLYAYYVEDTEKAEESKEAVHFGAEGINPASGNISFTCVDMVMKIPGLNYDMARTYNSKNEHPSALGRGWTFSFEGGCEIKDEKATVYLPDGSRHIFRKTDAGYVGETTHAKFSLNPDDTCVVIREDRSKYGFRADGTLAYMEDRNGNRTLVSYENGTISEIVDPVGRVYEITANAEGYLTGITDPAGNTVSYEYNEQNYLVAVTNLLGGVTEYVYDEQGILVKIIDPNGEVIQDFAYAEPGEAGAGGEVTRSMDAYGSVKRYVYSPGKNQTVVTGEDGREWIYWYNSDMYITDIQNPDGSMTKTEYAECEDGFSYGDVKSSVDEYGNKTEYETDANGNIVKVTYCDGSTVERQYDEWNNCIAEKDEMGVYTYYLYDENGINLLKQVQRVDGGIIDGDLEAVTAADKAYLVEEYSYYSGEEAKERFSCPLSGLLKSVINEEGEATVYTYDSYGNTETVTDAAGNVTEYSYDRLGHKLTELTPEGDKFSFAYLPNGFVTREYYPDGGVVVSEYDLAGNLKKSVPQEVYQAEKDTGEHYAGNEGVVYQYNAGGRLASVTDLLGNTVRYTYDCNGNLITEKTEGAEVITYEYDDRDRLIKQWYQETEEADRVLLKEVSYSAIPNGAYQVTTYLYTTEEDKIVYVAVTDNRGRQKEE
ncbi:MAG: InlB B-repeat-containing protein, partial [Lachnospiraceae bacterium]